MTFFTTYKTGILLQIKLTPNATALGFHGNAIDVDGCVYLKVSVTSVPEKGKANQELIKLLAKKLKLPKTAFHIISGETDRWKKVYIDIPLTDALIQNLKSLQKEE